MEYRLYFLLKKYKLFFNNFNAVVGMREKRTYTLEPEDI